MFGLINQKRRADAGVILPLSSCTKNIERKHQAWACHDPPDVRSRTFTAHTEHIVLKFEFRSVTILDKSNECHKHLSSRATCSIFQLKSNIS